MSEKAAAWSWQSKAAALAAMLVAHICAGAAAVWIPCAPINENSAMARGTSSDGVTLGAWLHFTWMVSLGIFYINAVTERRPTALTDRWGTMSNFRKILCGSAALWWLGPAYTLSEDMCMDSSLSQSQAFMRVLINGVIFRSLVSFFLPYLLGLHWTYLDNNPVLGQIECSRAGFSRMSARAWTVLAIAFMICTTAVAANVYFISVQPGAPVLYVLAGYTLALALIGSAAVFFVRIRQTHHVHLHHYQIFYLLMPLCTARDNYLASACQGVCMGIAVEGSSRWSWAPLIEHNQYTQRLAKNRRSRIMRALLAEPSLVGQLSPTPPASDDEAHIMSPVVLEPPEAPMASKSSKATVHPNRALYIPPAPWTIDEDSHEEHMALHNCAACGCMGETLTFRRGSCAAHAFVSLCYDIEGTCCCVGNLTDGLCQPDLNREDWETSPREASRLKGSCSSGDLPS